MITIRSSNISSEVALICLEATLTTPRGVFTISSNGPMIDSSPSGGGLFGAISWPRSRFRVTDKSSLEQQMFLPHDALAAAFSWFLRGDTFTSAQLVVRPFFSGCGPRSYRDVGFRFESEQDGDRLAWLPNVRGPSPTRTADITMSQRDHSIVFAIKQQRRLHLKILSRREALSLS